MNKKDDNEVDLRELRRKGLKALGIYFLIFFIILFFNLVVKVKIITQFLFYTNIIVFFYGFFYTAKFTILGNKKAWKNIKEGKPWIPQELTDLDENDQSFSRKSNKDNK